MNIKKFVASLLPSFEKGRIIEDLAILKQELNDHTLPPYAAASQAYKNAKFRSKEVQNFDKQFQSRVKVRGVSGNYVVTSGAVLAMTAARIDDIEALVNRTFSRDVAAAGLSYLKANLLQYIEAMSFATRYGRKLLLWTLSEENAASGATTQLSKALTKAEQQWLWANKDVYSYCLNILGVPTKDLETTLKNIPDLVVVPDQVDVVKETIGEVKLDPMKFNLIPIKLNPIYHLRIAIAEYQVARLKAAEQERLALEYRLMALKNEAEGKQDAKLDELIEYTEGRLQKLNRRIAEMEGDDHA